MGGYRKSNMAHLALEAKQRIIEKALNNKGQGITKHISKIASDHNIGSSTLEKWIRLHKIGKFGLNKTTTLNKSKLTAADRLEHLLATTNLDEAKLGAYCREHGLYSFQLQAWKKDFMTQENNLKKQPDLTIELKTLRTENQQLKKDLNRKNMALAETTALLVLKKKADLIWGVLEDN